MSGGDCLIVVISVSPRSPQFSYLPFFMKCAQTVFLVDEAVKRVKRVFISNVLWITARVVADLLECSVRVPAQNSCTQRWKSCRSQLSRRSLGRVSECQSALGVGRAVDSRIDQVCQERQTAVAPGSSTVISIANLLSRGLSP